MSVDINISNYEGFLLSYIDGELTEAEAHALRAFLLKYPHVKQELALLETTRLQPDENTVFDQKALLYRGAAAVPAYYESLLLSYIDDELDTAGELELNEYLRQHPAAVQELAMLQSVKLQPDTALRMENKSALYRSHKKNTRLYPAVWWAAAAAVVTGLLIWALPFREKTPQMAVVTPTAPATENTTAAAANATPAKKISTPATGNVTENTVAVSTTGNERAVTPANIQKTPAEQAQINIKKATAVDRTPAGTSATAALAVADKPAVKEEAPVISQLPPPRNVSEEMVESHLQLQAQLRINNDKQELLAANIPAPAPEKTTTGMPAPVQGELILSVSGSDSKLLDKVTNVAKLFSRRKHK